MTADMRNLIMIVEGMENPSVLLTEVRGVGDFLFHGTTRERADAILRDGVVDDPSHWGVWEIATHFAKGKINDEGGEAVVLAVPARFFDEHLFGVDENIIDFPISADFAHDPRQMRQWARSKKDWRACFRVFGALVYDGPIYLETAQVMTLDKQIVSNMVNGKAIGRSV